MILSDRNEEKIRMPKGRLIAALAISGLMPAAGIISYTPLMRIYAVNWAVSIIFKNSGNLVVLTAVLLVIFSIERIRYMDRLERKGEKKNGRRD